MANPPGIYTVLDDYDSIDEFDTFLLPYCAKLRDCENRYRDNCDRCGECTMGPAYELSEEYGLKPVTILNYEHLEATLKEIRDSGSDAFIGTCCEAFYLKHRDDFERIGVRGILIDIENTTCYDVDQVREAKSGEYEGETDLHIELIRRVLEDRSAKKGKRAATSSTKHDAARAETEA